MRKLILLLVVMATLFGCDNPPAGTMENIDHKPGDSIEVYRYFYNNDGSWIYVSYVKNNLVQTNTWMEQQGKFTVTRGNVVVNVNKPSDFFPSARAYIMASIHNKGVVLKKKEVIGDGHNLVIQTKDDVVKEKVTEEQYNIVQEGDTIK